MDKLKPCPICGGNATIIENTGRRKAEKQAFHAACNTYGCALYKGITPWSDTKETAADAWERNGKQAVTP